MENRLLVVTLVLLLALSGVYSALHVPLDAFPDTTPVQVAINADAPALSPEEVEQQVTLSIEQAIAGLPGLEVVRSISKTGFSQVVAIFSDDTDLYLARQQVGERMAAIELPEGIERPEMGPISTGLGEIYHYILTSEEYSLTELTTLHDWVVKPRMLSVRGVAEVNTWGGKIRQFHVLADPERLADYNLTLPDLVDALMRNNLSVGGGNIKQAGEMHLVRGVALTTTVEEIAGIVVATRQGVPVRVRDVAGVEEGYAIRRGAATAEGAGEAVLGLGFMLMGENSRQAADTSFGRLRSGATPRRARRVTHP